MSSLQGGEQWNDGTLAIRSVDELASLRINPGLRYKHRVDKGTAGALSLFLGNASDGLPRPRSEHWVLSDALSNIVELTTDDIVVQNHLDRGRFRVFRILESDLPAALSIHYTKVIPRSEEICRAYLCITLRAALKRVSRTWLSKEAPTHALSLRTLRELKLYWPARSIQQDIIKEHEDLTANYARARANLQDFEQRLHQASVPPTHPTRHSRG